MPLPLLAPLMGLARGAATQLPKLLQGAASQSGQMAQQMPGSMLSQMSKGFNPANVLGLAQQMKTGDDGNASPGNQSAIALALKAFTGGQRKENAALD